MMFLLLIGGVVIAGILLYSFIDTHINNLTSDEHNVKKTKVVPQKKQETPKLPQKDIYEPKVNRTYYVAGQWMSANEYRGFCFEDFVYHSFNKFGTIYDELIMWNKPGIESGRFVVRKYDFPDLVFKHLRDNGEFAVECKYRTSFQTVRFNGEEHNLICWASSEQIKKYREYTFRKTTMFVIIGIGGTPDNPDEIYCIPMSKIYSPYLNKKDIMAYQVHSASQGIFYIIRRNEYEMEFKHLIK